MKLFNDDPMMREVEEAVNEAFDLSQELTDRIRNILSPIQEGEQPSKEDIDAAQQLLKNVAAAVRRAKLVKV